MSETSTSNPLTKGRLILVRHGQTDWNKAGRMQGSTDIPLNDLGREQARKAGAEIAAADESWDLLVSSPLSRAQETAEIIGGVIGLEVSRTVPGLIERNYGEAEGVILSYEDSRHPQDLYSGVEAEADVYRRGIRALQEIVLAYPGEKIVAVSHGTLIRRVLLASTPGDWSNRVPNAMPLDVDIAGLLAWTPEGLEGRPKG